MYQKPRSTLKPPSSTLEEGKLEEKPIGLGAPPIENTPSHVGGAERIGSTLAAASDPPPPFGLGWRPVGWSRQGRPSSGVPGGAAERGEGDGQEVPEGAKEVPV